MKPKFTYSILLSFALLTGVAKAELLVDHIQQGLDSRYKDLEASDVMEAADKKNALSELEAMKNIATQAVSLSQIPSQQDYAEELVQQLHIQMQDFDKRMDAAK